MQPRGDRPWPGRPDHSLALALACSCCLHLILGVLPVGTLSPSPVQTATMGSKHKLDVSLAPPPAPMLLPVPIEQANSEPDPTPPPSPEAPSPAALPLPNHYFLASELDETAEPFDIPPLIYPEDAYLRKIEGKVVLRVFINATGNIDSVDLLSAEPRDLFEQSALDAVLATRFHPARLLGHPVNSQKVLEIRFNPFVDQ